MSTVEASPGRDRARRGELGLMSVGHMPEPARPPSASSTLDAPVVLGRYRLRRRLGAGGFGTVWMAHDERLGRDVAVKILPRERVVGGRFEREARAAARLVHPGIVTLYEAAADDEGAYLVSELVRGATLDRALAAGRLSDRGILAIGLLLCDALAHAHAEGVVHRDVKPSNILVPSRPATPEQVAKLTDFGVARVLGGDTLTRTGELIGTAGYMAPEQAEGREAGEAADLYSLALVIYEALTGVNPLPPPTAGAPRPRRLAVHLPPLRRQRRELPRELGQCIDQALRPRPSERGTVAGLRRGLEASLRGVADLPGVVGDPTVARAWRRLEAAEMPEPTQCESATDEVAELRPHAVAVRALGSLACALLAAWITSRLLSPAPLPAASAALLAGLGVMALPRLGWLAFGVSVSVTLAVQGHAGLGLVLAAAAVLPVALLPRARGEWPLAAFAPLLGLASLAGAWPALAARASSPWRRVVLGALGWSWLWVGAALAGRDLYTRRPPTLPAVAMWSDSPHAALHHVLGPLLSPALPAGGAVWALAAVALPVLERRVSAILAWCVALAAVQTLVLSVCGQGARAPSGGVLALGAVAAGLAALTPHALARARVRTRGAAPGLA